MAKSAPFKRILCPVDFSDHSRSALRYAGELARRSGGTVHLLYVSDPLLDAAAAAAAYDVAVLRKRTIEELEKFAGRAGLREMPELHVANGHPAPQIQRQSTRLKADLIVMGSHGMTGAAKAFFGSVTERMLRTSAVPMLIVPRLNRLRKESDKWLRGWPGPLAAVPVDLRDYRIDDIKHAVEVVRTLGASPLFVHAVATLRLPAWLGRARTSTVDHAPLEATWTAITRELGRPYQQAECQFVFGDAADQIAIAADRAEAGVIVISLRRGTTVFGSRRGSVSYRLVAKDLVPVLALPEAV